ncbi:xanthine dehydrogenase family protein molybdopterin-binding subunit [Chelatococcus reniformis]|uniref:Dehydrogenase n=1 Tax=Chelatococcus reniformis TaxID=1494448 RepID=A0A916UTG8_9HYPH|nr:xanthine dehydrogenase family protein molybdopterin-binding subunit [Chelatococcus reniformis]GGC86821.1 dehydrogenase [Chelatococcus reniformis]
MSRTAAQSAPRRKEDARLLRGAGRFVDDVHLDRMVEGAFVRSSRAHAEIVSVDASAALAAGALLVLTAADLPFNDRPWVTRYWHAAIRGGLPRFLATDRVRFVGEPIAFVVADDRYRAEDLAALVEVAYRELPVIATVADAVRPDAPRLHPDWLGNVGAHFQQATGNADAALRGAAHRVRETFSFVRQAPLPLETRGIVADYDEARQALTVWMSTQAHYNVRQNLSSILDLPEYQVRVVCEDVGGGFGAKSRTYVEELVVSHASRRLRRPVKWIEDRFENLQATTHSRAIDVDIELGCDEGGALLALKAQLRLDMGGYVFTSGIMTAEVAAGFIANAYRIPNFRVDVSCIGTNKTPIATYRGAGAPEAAFPIECLMDLLAKRAGLTPVELRRRNLIRPADLPHELERSLAGIPLRFESGDFPALLDQALADSGYSRDVVTEADGCRTAWGLAACIEGSGFVNFETAVIRADALGNVTVTSGMSTQGQGQHTTYAQVAAETLGVDFERVDVRMGDTQLVPFGRGAFASRGAIFGANAVLGAAERLREKILAVAADMLQAPADALTIAHGRIVRAAGGDTDLDIAAIARAVSPGGSHFAGEPALEAQYVYGSDQPLTFGGAVHVARVRLDPRTGFFRVLDYFVSHDAGRALNAMIVEGQIIGGVIDGIGGALYSELIYSDEGQLVTSTMADYLVATAPDLPRVRLGHVETRPGTNPLGVRGIGEGGLIPTAAVIANALAHAIAPGATGHEAPLYTLPLRPERVYTACRLATHRLVAPP